MTYKRPTREEFEIIDNKVKHTPTGAQWWWSYQNSKSEDITFRRASLGDVLPNGDDYRVDDGVRRIAVELLTEVRQKR